MYKVYCRAYQNVLRGAAYAIPWKKPEMIIGANAVFQIPTLLKEKGIHHVLLVTDKGIQAIGLANPLLDKLEEEKIQVTVYDKTVPNPTIDNIEEALELYKTKNCRAIIAFGGGSPMDCAKVVAARSVKPNQSVEKMKGLLKVNKQLPLLIAIPTTAGTGSEVTVAAVISNSKTYEKYAINDPSLTPHYAVLDPLLTVKLPPFITATTGMDALTHAVEAYIGKSNTKETRDSAKEAVKLIFNYLNEAYVNGDNIEARSNMQKASYLAGVAFTRAYVGYVHAIAHTLGGFYQVPHGLANAVILPYVLDSYGSSAHKKLAELADLVEITNPNDSNGVKATKFIKAIREMNKQMNIPMKIQGILEKDIPTMVERAFDEANPLYPVPRIFSKQDIKSIYYFIKE